MKPRFVAFNNGAERYLFNIDNISSVMISEFADKLLTIESLDGSLTEIDCVDIDYANNIYNGIINALNAPSNVMIYHILENTK